MHVVLFTIFKHNSLYFGWFGFAWQQIGGGGGGGGGGGVVLQPPVQAAHVSKVYVYSQLPGRLTAVHASGVRGPDLPAAGQI